MKIKRLIAWLVIITLACGCAPARALEDDWLGDWLAAAYALVDGLFAPDQAQDGWLGDWFVTAYALDDELTPPVFDRLNIILALEEDGLAYVDVFDYLTDEYIESYDMEWYAVGEYVFVWDDYDDFLMGYQDGSLICVNISDSREYAYLSPENPKTTAARYGAPLLTTWAFVTHVEDHAVVNDVSPQDSVTFYADGSAAFLPLSQDDDYAWGYFDGQLYMCASDDEYLYYFHVDLPEPGRLRLSGREGCYFEFAIDAEPQAHSPGLPPVLKLYASQETYAYDDPVYVYWTDFGIAREHFANIAVTTQDYEIFMPLDDHDRQLCRFELTDKIPRYEGVYHVTMKVFEQDEVRYTDTVQLTLQGDWAQAYVDRLLYGDLQTDYIQWVEKSRNINRPYEKNGYLVLDYLLDEEYDYQLYSKAYGVPLYNAVIAALKIDVAAAWTSVVSSFNQGTAMRLYNDILTDASVTYLAMMQQSVALADKESADAQEAQREMEERLIALTVGAVNEGENYVKLLRGDVLGQFNANDRDIRLLISRTLKENGVSSIDPARFEGLDIKASGNPAFRFEKGEAEKMYAVFERLGLLDGKEGQELAALYKRAKQQRTVENLSAAAKYISVPLSAWSIYDDWKDYGTRRTAAEHNAERSVQVMLQLSERYLAMLDALHGAGNDQQKRAIATFRDTAKAAMESEIGERLQTMERLSRDIADTATQGELGATVLNTVESIWNIADALGIPEKVGKKIGVSLVPSGKLSIATFLMEIAGTGMAFAGEKLWAVNSKYDAAERMYAVQQLIDTNVVALDRKLDAYKERPSHEAALEVIELLRHLYALKSIGERAAEDYLRIEYDQIMEEAYKESRDAFHQSLKKNNDLPWLSSLLLTVSPERSFCTSVIVYVNGNKTHIDSYYDLALLAREHGQESITLESPARVDKQPLPAMKELSAFIDTVVDLANATEKDVFSIFDISRQKLDSLEMPPVK